MQYKSKHPHNSMFKEANNVNKTMDEEILIYAILILNYAIQFFVKGYGFHDFSFEKRTSMTFSLLIQANFCQNVKEKKS